MKQAKKIDLKEDKYRQRVLEQNSNARFAHKIHKTIAFLKKQ